jgi:hypothetical protein
VKLDNGLERDVEKQLVVGAALDVVLGCSLAVTKTAWLGAIEKNPDTAGSLISVENLEISELYLIGDIAVASGSFGTLPVGSITAA